jgi:hypothetical protein
MHIAPLILELPIILAITGVATLLCKKIRQPLMMGDLMAGLIIGPRTFPFPLVTDISNIKTLADLGITFLIFNLGLEFSFRKLALVGAIANFRAPCDDTARAGRGTAGKGKLLSIRHPSISSGAPGCFQAAAARWTIAAIRGGATSPSCRARVERSAAAGAALH